MLRRIFRAANLLPFTLAALFFGACLAAAEATPSAVLSTLQAELPNMSQVAPNFFRGGQPDARSLAQLRDAGVKVIVSLDNERHLIARESVAAQQLGLKFISIPINALQGPSDFDILRFLDIVSRKDDEPVYVHCVHGRDRTGAMVGIYRQVHDHWSPDQAYNEMMTHGYRPFFTRMANAVFDVGRQLGEEGHRPSIGFITTHLTGRITDRPPIAQ